MTDKDRRKQADEKRDAVLRRMLMTPKPNKDQAKNDRAKSAASSGAGAKDTTLRRHMETEK